MSLSSMEVMGTPAELFHWVPGEMVVVVRLTRIPLNDALEALVEQVRVQLDTFLARYTLTLELYGTAGRWSDNAAMPPLRRRAFIFGLKREQPLAALFFHVRFRIEQQIVDPLPAAISYIQGHLEQFAQQGLHIVSAMPNWLMTAAPLLYSEGGGAFPAQPAPSLDLAAAANMRTGWHLRFAASEWLSANAAQQDGRDVQVIVLDTAHHPDRIRSAATRPELRRNWLLQRLAEDLRQEDGSLSIEYDRYPAINDVRTGHDMRGLPRYSLMPDHGFAVTGIVRDLAPAAQIRLVRILNDYGGGDLYNLFAALSDIEHELHAGTMRNVVINLSLTIMPDIRRLSYIWFADRQWSNTRLMGIVRILQHIEEGLRQLFSSLAEHGALIVAAAGNNSQLMHRLGRAPRPPRAPARYDTVLSATSINSNFLPSGFANAANMGSQHSGVATFGGDVPGTLDKNGLPDAIRGLYIAPAFSNGHVNSSGWADWRGTSFSTSIISALGARLMSEGLSSAAIMARLTNGADTRIEASFGTPPDTPQLLTNSIRVEQTFGI